MNSCALAACAARHDVVHRLPEVAVGDVGADGVVEEEGELRDDGDLRAQRAQRVVADVDAVDRDPPLGHVVEARDQIGEGALAAAAHADERDDLAGLDREVDVLQHGLGAVAKADVLEDDPAAHGRERAGAGAVDDLGRVSSSSNTRSAPATPCWIVAFDLAEPLERLVEEEHRGQEREKRALAAPAGDDAVAAVPDDAADREGREHLQRRRGEGLDHAGLHVEPIETPVLGLEALALVLLHAEGLHDAIALHGLLEERGEDDRACVARAC